MSSQHAEPSLNVRVPAAVLQQSRDLLGTRELQMRAFVVACLGALADDPDRTLEALAPYWPTPKRRGRPPRHDNGTPAATSGV